MTRGAEIGTAIVAYIEPHPGAAREFNRWYERDHFPAAVMAGPGVFAGARFVATRACKAVRPDGAMFGTREQGSYLAVAWLLPDAQAEWDAWVARQVDALVAQDRMFPHRDHLHTAVYRRCSEARAPDGPPAAQALDRGFPGVVALAIERATVPDDGIEAWMHSLVGPELPVAVAFEQERLVASVLDRSAGDGSRSDAVLVLAFVSGAVLDTWRERVEPALERLAATGARIGWASPFLRTLPGSDLYADDL